MKISIYSLVIFLCCFQFHFPQTDNTIPGNTSLDRKLHIGDEFTYLVKYAFLNLGELKTGVYEKDTLNGKPIYKSIAYINSYEGLPFVNIHQVYESWFDSTFQPVFFNALIFYDSDTSFSRYYFLDNNKIHIKKGKISSNKTSTDTIISLSHKCQDGLSLLYYARFMSRIKKKQIIPCFINEDTSFTTINYIEGKEAVSIDAVEFEVGSFSIEGEIGFTGIFGLTGDFKGWFSIDEFNVPLTANLEVIIGDITLELIDWKKGKWQPPAYD